MAVQQYMNYYFVNENVYEINVEPKSYAYIPLSIDFSLVMLVTMIYDKCRTCAININFHGSHRAY